MTDVSFVIALECFLIMLIMYGIIMLIVYTSLEIVYAYRNETAEEIVKYHVNCMRKEMHLPPNKAWVNISFKIDFEKTFYLHVNLLHEYFYANQKYAEDMFKNPWTIACNLVYQPSHIEIRPYIYTKTIMYKPLLGNAPVKKEYIDDSFDIPKQKYIMNCRRLKPFLKMSLAIKQHVSKEWLQSTWHEGVPEGLIYDRAYLRSYLNKKLERYTKFNIFLDFLYWMFIEKIIILQHKIFKK